MIILCNTLLPNDRAHGIQLKIGTIIKPKPVTGNVIDVLVATIIKTVSTDSNDEVSVLQFL